MIDNLILATDAYKMTHHLQYPAGLTQLYSYGEARVGGESPTVSWFGLQSVVAEHLLTLITTAMIDEAEELSALTFGTTAYFNRDVWERVRDLGYLPIRIKALPEGLEVPLGVPLFTLESTEVWFATTLNALETVLMHVWYPTTIATNSLYIKRALAPLFAQSGTVALLESAVNDFGLRGSTSLLSGARGAAAHLLHFTGTATLPAQSLLQAIYHGDYGRSIRSSEHSVATAFGAEQGELVYLRAQLDSAPADLPVSVVIDSYDTLGFVANVVPVFAEEILARRGRTIFRPDSGEPTQVVPAVLAQLAQIFGSTVNDKGYRVLNGNIGVMQGDGMNATTIVNLYKTLMTAGWSVDNLTTGSGGGLLQEGFTRDTQRFAIKASYAKINGEDVNLHKQPKTDPTKISKAGRFKVVRIEGQLTTVQVDDLRPDELRILLENGQFYPEDWSDILQRAEEFD
ncbi:MAG TPA: nicotinate phosphoribosyltransferase [Lactobacillaceae bacterium]